MCKKRLTVLFLGALSVLVSCVDNKYDLANKDIATDVKIEGNRIAVPFGNLEAITLDSMVDVDDIDILKKGDDGLFRINVSDTIDTVRVEIDPVELSVDLQPHSEVINFETVEIDTVHIEATNIEPIEFKAPEITLDSLNKKLPRLTSSVKTLIESDEIDAFFDILEKNPSLIKPQVIPIKDTFGTGTQNVSCDFEYELPSEVEEINTIWLGSSKSSTGTLVEVLVTTSSLFENVSKTVDFTITFPDYFVLYTDKYTQPKDNVITVNDLELKDTRNVVSFYIKAIKDISDKIDEKSGVLKIDDDINYSLEYKLDGNVELSSDVKREDLYFNVGLDVQLTFSDAEGSLKDIDVDFEPIEMDFKAHFDDLEHIDEIYYVDFNEDESLLKFVSTMDTAWLGGFAMKDGYALKVQFPHNISINDNKSTYEGKGSKIIYTADDHAFYIYDLKALANTDWNLALDRLDLNVPVVGESCDIDVMAKVYFVDAQKDSVGSFELGGIHTESMVETLDKLKGNKSATFSMKATDLVIDEASVHTEVITSSFDTSTDFTINEEIPEDIGCIEGIDFCDMVVMEVDLGVSGLDDLNADVRLDIDVDMPSFLVINPQNNLESDVVIRKDGNSNRLHIEATVNPYVSPHLGFGFECERLYFKTEEFGYKGAMPNDSTDGKSYLTYDGRITVKGEASIKGVEYHASVLERLNEIKFDISASLNDMQVKTFHGSYRGEIDPVEESIEIDLGEELDFLKEEGNFITLAEPQIEIVLKNTICVPVDVEMQIHSKDDKGVTISSITVGKNDGVSILPAKYDERTGDVEPVTTKIFLTVDSTRVSKIGYNNVEIKELANLLERIPDNIEFKIQPIVDQSCTHHVDITDTLTFSGTYDVNIPLKFDNFNFVYNDTITGLAESLGENVDMLSNIKLNAKMNITNTIPLALKMDIEPLDIDGNRIDGMEVDSVFIKAGNGGAINGSDQESQEVVLSIKSNSGDFSLLDMLSLSINAASDHTTGSVGIKGAQGIKVEDILLEIFGDIEMDLNE